jgi:hypothetical protein
MRCITPDLPTKTLYAPLLFPIRATRPAYLTLNFITRIIFGEYSLCSSFKKVLCSSSTFICLVFYNISLLNYRCVQNRAPGCPVHNVFIMRLCMGLYVITRPSEKRAGSFVLPEDGGSCFPPTSR